MTFPIDWDEWSREWRSWKSQHSKDLRPTAVHFPGKNFLADSILGRWKINDRDTELSEVVFPNLTDRDAATGRLLDYRVRAIGITFMIDGELVSGDVAHSFDELEQLLSISPGGGRGPNRGGLSR